MTDFLLATLILVVLVSAISIDNHVRKLLDAIKGLEDD